LRITLAFVATALMAVVVSFVLGAMVAAPLLAALLAMIVSGGIAAVFGYVFGGATAQALADLNNVILRFTNGTWTAWCRTPPAPTRSATLPRR
jgi:hypothetical protein